MSLSQTIESILFDVQYSKGRYDADEGFTAEEVRILATDAIIEAVERADDIR